MTFITNLRSECGCCHHSRTACDLAALWPMVCQLVLIYRLVNTEDEAFRALGSTPDICSYSGRSPTVDARDVRRRGSDTALRV